MTHHDLHILRRREILGTIALVAWGIGLLSAVAGLGDPTTFFVIVGWLSAACWVALDAVYLRRRPFLWTAFSLLTGPVGVLLYLLFRPYAPAICPKCGAIRTADSNACPACGQKSYSAILTPALKRVYESLANALARGPIEQARRTAKGMAFALVGTAVFGHLLSRSVPDNLSGLANLLWALSFAGYWALAAWWVYLDASWRRMNAAPWGVLTLVTNVFGLATYLVIRDPDPRSCRQCGAYLPPDLKRCPYCGVETEPTCPRCQAQVRPDWVYCPSCAARLPDARVEDTVPDRPQPPAPMLSITGTVCDTLTGSPIVGAEVMIDSKANSRTTTTDSSGGFILTDLSPAPYVLIASAEGHISRARPFVPSAFGAAPLRFSLMPSVSSNEIGDAGNID